METIEGIFRGIGNLFRLIYTSAQLLWEFFGSPVPEDIVELLELDPSTTMLEFLFGSGLVITLLFILVRRFFTGLS